MKQKITVVIPAYNVAGQVIEVIRSIGKEISEIIVVDDACPQQSGKKVKKLINDKRVKIIFNKSNLGVGGSMVTGYREALKSSPKYIVKIDGDGQMDPNLIPLFLERLNQTGADYAKGNRFANLENLSSMPKIRVFGNLFLSFFAKFSTGYWNIFDPNNGFTIIKSEALVRLPLNKISQRYFFESDMLFRLNLINAYVIDIPMRARYTTEQSNLKISKSLIEFPLKHFKNFAKRIAYNYFLRDFNFASLELILAVICLTTGIATGSWNLFYALKTETSMSVGILVLVSILILSGLQLLLNFFTYDMSSRVHNKSW